ncbi:MAG: LysR family transcriptional regulator, partial [Bdellovibrionales bacterium]|nr:LysR family transcriptional regulator [Bdellovibrionales bacterium]
MNISREHAKAFLALTRKKSFSAAAEFLGITQAALSIRIQRLEEELQHTLVVRNKTGATLTEAGKKFLAYCEMIEGLEVEFLDDFTENNKQIKGAIRIGTFSTIGRSVVLPVFHNFLRNNPQLHFSYMTKELSELPDLLLSSEMDFIFLDHPMNKEGIESHYLGDEEYVFITSATNQINQDIFLNHDERDMMSFRYFDFFKQPIKQLKRKYLDEIYSVIDGVAAGWGVSVLPEHLIKADPRIKIVNPKKKLPSAVYLCFRSRTYYPKVFQTALE